MDRVMVRIVGGIILAVVAISIKFCMGTERREDASKEVLTAARQMIKEVPGYDQDPAYMDWLVNEGHRQVFNDSYHIDIGSRYSAGRDSMDLDHYFDDLFHWMIDRSKTDGRTTVADNLKKYQDDPEAAAEPADKNAKNAKKAPADNPFVKK